MEQLAYVITNVKHTIRPQKRVRTKQTEQLVQPDCAKTERVRMIHVRPEQLKHARLIWSQPHHLKRRTGHNVIRAVVQVGQH